MILLRAWLSALLDEYGLAVFTELVLLLARRQQLTQAIQQSNITCYQKTTVVDKNRDETSCYGKMWKLGEQESPGLGKIESKYESFWLQYPWSVIKSAASYEEAETELLSQGVWLKLPEHVITIDPDND